MVLWVYKAELIHRRLRSATAYPPPAEYERACFRHQAETTAAA